MPSATSRRATPSPALAFEIRRSAIAGAGAYAIRPIKKGEKLIEYVGERVSHPVADARYDDAAEQDHHTFLFAVSSRTVIDATVGGNDSRFINHSCEPNCEAEIEQGRVFIYALRNIKVGEELAYDYAYERDGTETEKEERYYKCLCGSPMCRGTIMEPKSELLKRQRAKQRALAKKRKAGKKKKAPAKKTKSAAKKK